MGVEGRRSYLNRNLWILIGVLSAAVSVQAETEQIIETGHFWQNIAMAASAEQGCYTLQETGIGGAWITYIDDQTNCEVYLCGKPDCLHERMDVKATDPDLEERLSSCNAYAGKTIPHSIYYKDGYVYYLGYEEANYEVTLKRVSADGSIHEEIAVVGQSSVGAGIYSYLTLDEFCYFAYMPFTFDVEEKRTAELLKIHLDDGEIENLYSFEEIYASFSYLKRCGDDIYFLQSGYDEDGSSMKTLKCLDTVSGEISDVLKERISRYAVTEKGEIYYFVVFEGIHHYDPESGEDTLIWECKEDSQVVEMCYNGTWLFLDNDVTHRFLNDSPKTLIVLDKNGEEWNRIDMENYQSVLVNERHFLAEEYDSGSESVVWNVISGDCIADANYTWTEIISACGHKRNGIDE